MGNVGKHGNQADVEELTETSEGWRLRDHEMKTRIAAPICCLLIFVVAAWAAPAKTYDLNDPAEPWRTARAGISTEVMPPHTPLERDGDRVRCWGRVYVLGSLFPSEATSREQKLLAAPIALQRKAGDQWHASKAGTFRFTTERGDRMDFEASSGFDGIEVSAKSWIEYGGLIRTDLVLRGDESVTVEGLRLVIPFAPEASIFHHGEMRWAHEIFERSPSETGRETSYPWMPLIWVGNHDMGLTVVTETWDGWTSADKGALRLVRTGTAMELHLNIITQPTALEKPLRYRIGLLATPAKPMPKDRYTLRPYGLPGSTLITGMGDWGANFQPLFSFPQPADFDKFAERLAKERARGHRYCYYITTSAVSNKTPVEKRNRADWLMSDRIFEGDEWQTSKGLIGVDSSCPASSFSDFMAWSVEQVVTRFDVGGIYIDNPGPYWCLNTRHGCGPGGKRKFPYFALHDLHRRLYTIVKSRRPGGVIWEHTSRTFNPLQLAWIDLYSDGEPYRRTKNYPKHVMPKVLSRTYFEISGTGHQVGAVPAFLSSMGVRGDGDWTQWLLSRVLPWGSLTWNEHGVVDGSVANAVARTRDAFGLGREAVDFYRPHELPEWFHLRGGDVIGCMWQRKADGAVLAVLANWGSEAVLARIDEKRVAAHLGPCVMFDAMNGAEVPDPFKVSVPALSFRMVRIESDGAR
ncbi:MAG: hypothetical protein CMJ18_02925 [Phycisphaeraceae bacterium]|nr:hypothetical protein [Phycisphaeraceae bacterium]